MQNKQVALVTGANQGIGLQIAKDLASHGLTVLVGSRNLERGEAAAKTIDGDAHALQLDVTDQASIAAAAQRIRNEFGRLDVLINNAAISNTGMRPGMTIEEYAKKTRPSERVARRGARGVGDQRVRRARGLPGDAAAVARGAARAHRQRVERRGLADDELGPGFPYRAIFGPVYPASKTALNAMTVAMAIELESTGIKVNAVSPGFTKTNLNDYSGTETVEEGAAEAVRVALLGPDGPTGTFTHAKTRNDPVVIDLLLTFRLF